MRDSVVLVAILQVLTLPVGLVRAKSLAVILGPAEFGIVSTIDQLVLTILTLGAFATPFTALKFMARDHSESVERFQRSAAGFLRLMIVLGLLTTCFALGLVIWWSSVFGTELAPYRAALVTAILSVPSALLLMLFVNAFAAADRPVAAALVGLSSITALTTASVVGALTDGVDGLYVANLAAALTVTMVGLWLLAHVLGVRFRSGDRGIVAMLRGDPTVAGYSLSFYATFSTINLMMLLARTLVLSKLGEAAVGHLQAVMSIALAVGAVLYAVSNVYLGPLVNRTGRPEEKTATANAYAKVMLLLLLPAATLAVAFPDLLLRLLFSTAFVDVAPVLWLFVIWQSVFQIAYVYHLLLIGLDDVLYASSSLIAGCLVAISLMGRFGTWLGVGGVAVALSLGMLCWGAAILMRLRFKYQSAVLPELGTRILAALAVVVLTGLYFASRPSLRGVEGVLRFGVVFAVAVGCWYQLGPAVRNPKAWLDALNARRAGSTVASN